MKVTQTDPQGHQSPPANVTVDQSAPAAPTIKPISTTDTVVTGTGEPGNIVNLSGGGITCTNAPIMVKQDGTWSCTIASPLPVDTVITATLTDPSGNTSTPTTTKVYDPTNVSQTPVLNPVNTLDKVITGTAVPGATITITGATCTNAPIIANGAGMWTCKLANPLPVDTIVTATATELDKSPSDPSTTKVSDADKTSPSAPTVNPTDGSKLTGTGEPGDTISVKNPIGNEICTATVQADGTWSCTPSVIAPDGTLLKVTQTDTQGHVSPPASVIVDQTAPAAPTIKPISTKDTTISGTGEPGDTVNVTGTGVTCTNAPIMVKQDGTWSCTIATPLPVDTVVTATLTDPAGNTSTPTSTKVYDPTKVSQTPTINPVNTLDKVVTGTAVPGSIITPGVGLVCTNSPVQANGAGMWTCILANPLPADSIVTVSATETGKAASNPATTKVSDAADTSPSAPTINPTDGSPINGTGEPGAKVTVTDPTGAVVCTATVAADGTWTCTPATIPADGTVLKATQTDPQGHISPPAYVKVDQKAPDAPVIDPVNATDTTVTGTGEPGDVVTISGVTCTNVPIYVDASGIWKCILKDPVSPSITISAFQTDPAGNVSPTTKLALSDDLDGDSVPDSEENTAIGGDGNADGVQDARQSSIVSRKNPVTSAPITMAISGTCDRAKSFTINTETQLTVQDPNYDYPLGIFGFKLICKNVGETATVDFTFDKVYDTTTWKWRKFSKGAYNDWTQFIGYTVKKVNGKDVTVATIKVTDGGFGDEDGIANGVIIDPSGPAMPIVKAELPRTGGEMNLQIILAIAMFGVSAMVYKLKRRQLVAN